MDKYRVVWMHAHGRDYMVNDGWPVIAEDYMQWVVESNFADGMPAWDKVLTSRIHRGACAVSPDRCRFLYEQKFLHTPQ